MSGFDGARVVDIAPHGAACEGLPCVSLGAQWNSRKPDATIATVTVLGARFSGIRRLAISIDGQERTFQPSGITRFEPGPTAQTRESRQDFVLPLATLREIRAAKRVWVRVSTVDGYLDQAVVDDQKDSKAFHALGRLLAEIDGK